MTSPQSTGIEAALQHGVDVAGRRVFLHGYVDEGSIGVAIRGMYLLADLESSPIELFVSSYGGELDEAFALHDVTRTIRVPVPTVALGKCQSAAPLLVACGHPGYRWASENTVFMIHDASLDAEGSPSYVLGHAEAVKMRDAGIQEIEFSWRQSGRRLGSTHRHTWTCPAHGCPRMYTAEDGYFNSGDEKSANEPACPIHSLPMAIESQDPGARRYRCPGEGCAQQVSVPR